MRWTIGKRIFLAVTLASLVIVALFSIATRLSFERSFDDYLAAQEDGRVSDIVLELAELYSLQDSWTEVSNSPKIWDDLVRPDRPPNRDRRPPLHGKPPPGGAPPHDGKPSDLAGRMQLVDVDGNYIAGRRTLQTDTRSFAIEHHGATVGNLLIARNNQLTEAVDIRFSAQQQRSTIALAVAVLLIAAMIAGLLARQLTRPIQTLAGGTRELIAGSYERRITVVRDDELGDLARDFNALAETLQRTQQSRKQWVSDIAHELRTPLSILSGELQAIEDGVRTFDAATLQSLQSEVDRLGRLVADLHTLTTSDEGGLSIRQEPIDLSQLLRTTLENSAARFRAGNIALDVQLPEKRLIVSGDPVRLEQLLTNLLENSLRYTHAPGRIDVKATSGATHATISISDTAPGVADADLPRLFERLYRVDSSRNRNTGGSGLGLAICAAIVAAHNGDISAQHADAGGIEIVVRLPLTTDGKR